MLSPQVWTFPPPKSTFKQRFGHFQENNIAVKTIQDFHFNHLVSIVIPDIVHTPKDLLNTLATDTDYYKIENLSIGELVESDFINNFLRNGKVTLLSINTNIDIDDCICLTPTGFLVLSLRKNTFEGLGLEGKVSHFGTKTKERYIVQLDIKSDTFTKNKKLHQRTIQKLNNHLQKFTVILIWDSNDENICPSSIAKYFADRDYDVKLCSLQFNTRTEYSVDVPIFCDDLTKSCETNELVEWLGMFSLSGDLVNGKPESYTNTYETPEPKVNYGQVQYLEWRGLFSSNKVEKMFEELRNYLSTNETISWISLYIQGFSDCPVVWGLQEHHYYTNGDNSIVIFLLPSDKYLLCTQKCSNQRHK